MHSCAHVPPALPACPQVRAVWHLQREEPVVYINGRPYVLREAARPFKNLLEYHGIVPERLERMEARLRVREAFQVLFSVVFKGGRLLEASGSC